jgi:hypothetical protein
VCEGEGIRRTDVEEGNGNEEKRLTQQNNLREFRKEGKRRERWIN